MQQTKIWSLGSGQLLKRNFSFVVVFVLLVALFILPHGLHASFGGTTKPKNKNVVWCDLNPSSATTVLPTLRADCGGKKGYIKNNVPIEYLKVVVKSQEGVKREVTLRNPPVGDIEELYFSPKDNKWVRANIPFLQATDQIKLVAIPFGLDGKTLIYSDARGLQLMGNIAAPHPQPEEFRPAPPAVAF